MKEIVEKVHSQMKDPVNKYKIINIFLKTNIFSQKQHLWQFAFLSFFHFMKLKD